MSNFSDTLKELISDKDLDNKSFASEVGICGSSISGYTLYGIFPTVENLIKIADYFHCSTDFLLGREEENPNLTFKPCPPFAERLNALLAHFGCSSYWILHNTEITKSRYYEWKSGKRQPSVDNVIKLAELFHCRVDFILGREA